ncbi:hypothetical protein HYV80_00415 [Candidatus Woesearchaeota archaeon]|nr:hypothetical protein [Candidatus Woesearchaeota archaeon]
MGDRYTLKQVGAAPHTPEYPGEIPLSGLEKTIFKREYTGSDGKPHADIISLKPRDRFIIAEVESGYFNVDTGAE